MSASSRAERRCQESRLRALGIKTGCSSRVHVAVGPRNFVQPCHDPACVYRGRRQ